MEKKIIIKSKSKYKRFFGITDTESKINVKSFCKHDLCLECDIEYEKDDIISGGSFNNVFKAIIKNCTQETKKPPDVVLRISHAKDEIIFIHETLTEQEQWQRSYFYKELMGLHVQQLLSTNCRYIAKVFDFGIFKKSIQINVYGVIEKGVSLRKKMEEGQQVEVKKNMIIKSSINLLISRVKHDKQKIINKIKGWYEKNDMIITQNSDIDNIIKKCIELSVSY